MSDSWDDSVHQLTAVQGRHAARAALCLALLRAARPRWAAVVDASADEEGLLFRRLRRVVTVIDRGFSSADNYGTRVLRVVGGVGGAVVEFAE